LEDLDVDGFNQFYGHRAGSCSANEENQKCICLFNDATSSGDKEMQT
jgi:hypothetical protein